MSNYTKLSIRATEEQGDILAAYIADFPFESFDYQDGIFGAYAPTSEVELYRQDIEEMLEGEGFLDWRFEEIEQQNWNAVWESDFEEVEVDGRVLIRAPFHEPRADYNGLEIVIQPKMSFGTGHHATTRLMVEALLGMELQGKRVLDMGSGTGVLAIVSAKLGAESVLAVEIDNMAEESVRENIALNEVTDRVESVCGDVRAIEGREFDIVLANINRNILLADMAAYTATLAEGGILAISGFLEEDIAILAEKAKMLGYKQIEHSKCDVWQILEFEKIK
ncbi:MAG: 50S ribosomal protein L11 methyltransferase [Alistipes sp.]|nr:50S ribosomal protein L11 methyltransferase [Alistipes sp.]